MTSVLQWFDLENVPMQSRDSRTHRAKGSPCRLFVLKAALFRDAAFAVMSGAASVAGAVIADDATDADLATGLRANSGLLDIFVAASGTPGAAAVEGAPPVSGPADCRSAVCSTPTLSSGR